MKTSGYGARLKAGTTRGGILPPLRRRLVPRDFGLVQSELLGDRFGDARTRAQPLVIGLHCRPFCPFARPNPQLPVEVRGEVGIRGTESVRAEFLVAEVVLDILGPQKARA